MLQETRENGWVVLKPETDEERYLSPFEREVCDQILGSDPRWSIARKQIESALVVDRELTGVGSYTNLQIQCGELDPAITSGIGRNIWVRCDSCPIGATALFLGGAGHIQVIELASVMDWSAEDMMAILFGDDPSVEFTVEWSQA